MFLAGQRRRRAAPRRRAPRARVAPAAPCRRTSAPEPSSRLPNTARSIPRQHARRGAPKSALPACRTPERAPPYVLAPAACLPPYRHLLALPSPVLTVRASPIRAAAPPLTRRPPPPRCAKPLALVVPVPPRPGRRRRRVHCSARVHHCLSTPK
jgi:hypothetical protein